MNRWEKPARSIVGGISSLNRGSWEMFITLQISLYIHIYIYIRRHDVPADCKKGQHRRRKANSI